MKLLFKGVSAVALVVLWRLVSPFSTSAATNYVAYGGPTTAYYNFRPSNLTIQAGDTVIWTNAGGVHTVTGLSTGEPLCGNSAVNACTNTFNTPGVFLYQCNFHAASFNMTGVVNVVGVSLSPAALTNAVWTNGDFVFTAVTTPNQTNVVQAATNLAAANWLPLDTNVPATNTFTFTDTNATRFPSRFYRVVQP
jgi:plastocyanin